MMQPQKKAEIKPFPRYLDVTEASRIYLLPNSFTAVNLLFGFLAIIRCIQARYSVGLIDGSSHYYTQAVWCILIACIFDVLDGRIARMGGKESLFGKEFDSITDMVSFGVAPALMVFFMILSPTENYPFFRQIGWLIGFIYLLCAGVRLARFNVITHPFLNTAEGSESNDFVGLPVPAAAGMIASLVLLMNEYDLKRYTLVLPGFMLMVAWLMVSTIEYPSLKRLGWTTRLSIPLFILCCGLLPVAFWYYAVSFSGLFVVYIGFGFIRWIWRRFREKKDPALPSPMDHG